MKLFDPPCRNTEICPPWKSCLECEWRVCVSDILWSRDVEEYRDLEILVEGHSGSLEMAQFDRSHTSSYWLFLVTMVLFCIISEIERHIGRKSRLFHTSPALIAPVKVNAERHRNSAIVFRAEQLEWWGYRWWKSVTIRLRLGICVLVTIQYMNATDIRTDKWTWHIAYAVLS